MKPLPLLAQLRDIRRQQSISQRTLAPRIGVEQGRLSGYETGRMQPSIRVVDTWARTLGHRLVITRHGRVIGDLATLLPSIPDQRIRLGYSQAQLGIRVRVSRSWIGRLDSRIRAGCDVRLATIQPYLDVLGYDLQLVPARSEERAA